jgi:archaemetzincin
MTAAEGYIDLLVSADVEDRLVSALGSCVAGTFGVPARLRGAFREPEAARDAKRGQYSSPVLLQEMARRLADDSFRLLGITGRDVFMPALTFVFGQAQLGGRVALISLARLRQEFYRIPADPLLCMERACKEALHELGHTFGLTHCVERACVMSLANTIQHVDLKVVGFCPSCATLLREGEGECDVSPWTGFRLEDEP